MSAPELRSRNRNLGEQGCRTSIYFPEHIIGDLVKQSERLDRSISWIVQRCVKAGGLEAVQAIEATHE